MTPDQYRREGAEAMQKAAADHCWSKRDLLADAEKRQIDVGLSGRDYYGRRLEAELLSRAIRAIDVDEVLAGLGPAPDAVAQLVEAARASADHPAGHVARSRRHRREGGESPERQRQPVFRQREKRRDGDRP